MRLPSGITVPPFGNAEDRRDRLQSLLTPLNYHIAGAVALLLLCIYFGVRLLLVSGNTGTAGDEAIVNAQARVTAAELSAKPLRGVDTKLHESDAEAGQFFHDRLPYADSDVAAQLGALAKKNNVRLSRASYVHSLPAEGVTEMRIDASVTGEYRSLAQFINGVERDRSFFMIENLALSGAQNGLVNLQLRIGTYIREPMPTGAAVQAQTGGQP
jgi:type IV pilus assembly protein PilO